MSRVAAIDIGTNSVLLLVAEKNESGVHAVVERATITRLGQGVDRTGVLADEARARTLECLRAYADEARSLGVSRVVAAGTSAMRDAANGPAFAAEAGAILGDAPRVITGEEEARVTFLGAIAGLDVRGPLSVFDVGGGSTEVIHASWDGTTAHGVRARSADVGSVRLFERHVRHDPPLPAELEAAAADVRRALDALGEPPPRGTVVGVAGTVTTLAAVALALEPYDGAKVHGARITTAELECVHARLAALPLEARKAVPGLSPKRADVIVTGGVVVLETLRRLDASEVVVSDRGVRWGLALAAFGTD